MSAGRRRWPPGDKQEPRSGEWPPPAGFGPMAAAIGDLSKALEHLAPSIVIGSATYALDSAGIAGEQYRAQFAALSVTSSSAFPLILSAGPRAIAAPGVGPGTFIVPPYGQITVNAKGYVWSLYGGAQGDLVTVQAFAKPMAPAASVGAFATAKQAWTNLANGAGQTLTASGSSPVIQTAPYSTVGLQVSVLGAVTGTTPSMTLTIYGLDLLGNLVPLAAGTALTAAGVQSVSAGPGTANGQVLPNTLVVGWSISGTTPSFGNTLLTLLGRE